MSNIHKREIIRDLHISEIVHQVVYLISKREDYNSSAKLMIDNSITIDVLSNYTFKLSQVEIAKLTDSIVKNRA